MANLKNRLVTLESRYPAKRENKYVFTTRTGLDNGEIIGFNCRGLKIQRLINETFEDFQSRATMFFAHNNSETTVFIIQCLYEDCD